MLVPVTQGQQLLLPPLTTWATSNETPSLAEMIYYNTVLPFPGNTKAGVREPERVN